MLAGDCCYAVSQILYSFYYDIFTMIKYVQYYFAVSAAAVYVHNNKTTLKNNSSKDLYVPRLIVDILALDILYYKIYGTRIVFA